MLFSVVIPAYNYAQYLPLAIESVLAQAGDDYEIVVIDDGSVDNSPAVAADYSRRFLGLLRYIRQDNRGPAAVRNRGVAETSGEYLIFLDADDKLLPRALEHFREIIRTQSHPDFAFGGHVSVQVNGTRKEHRPRPLSGDNQRDFIRYLRKQFGISNGSAIMARRIFDRVRYPEHLRNSEDIPVFAQTLALFRCCSFPHIVLETLRHPGSLRSDHEAMRKASEAITDTVFDSALLPAQLLGYRAEFEARQKLSLFRSRYLSGQHAEARRLYRQAVCQFPRLFFEWGYLRKYLRLLLK